MLFQSPLLLGTVDLPQVVNASIFLRGGTGAHEVRNRDRRQKANDGHDNHDFHEREARLARILVLFHFLFFPYHAAWTARQAGLDNYGASTRIACRNHM